LGACGEFGGGGDHGRDPTWEVTVKGPNLMSLFVRDAIFLFWQVLSCFGEECTDVI
jgi:hypothetical protein